MNSKGFTPIYIVMGIVILAAASFYVGKFYWSNPTPDIVEKSLLNLSPSPTPILSSQSTPTVSVSKSPQITIKPTDIPTPTTIPSPYTITAELICANADYGYESGNHVDLSYNVSVSAGYENFPSVLTLTDTKTNTTFELTRIDSIGVGGGANMHSSVQNSDRSIMPFVADGRNYVLKLYRLSSRDQSLTQNIKPVAQLSFSKVCKF